MKRSKRAVRGARRLFRACTVNGVLDEGRVRQVVRRVIASRRRDRLAMLSHFQRLVRLDQERHAARVETAVPLADDLKSSVAAGVTHRYGTGLSVSFVENPDLIGGMRVKVGSDVYDGSVRARLAALGARF